MAFHTREHSLCDRPEYVLVQGKAALTSLDDPDAEIRMYSRSGHYLHLDDPEGAAKAVVPFLKRQLDARPKEQGEVVEQSLD